MHVNACVHAVYKYTCSRTKIKWQKIHFHSLYNKAYKEPIKINILKAVLVCVAIIWEVFHPKVDSMSKFCMQACDSRLRMG